MKGLLLISHGPFAQGLYETTTWFFGEDIPQTAYLCLMPTDNPEEFTKKIEEKVHELNTGEGVVVMCDLFGGSPFKSALEYMLVHNDIKLLTGMNLPMVMEYLGKRFSDDYDFPAILQASQEGIIDFAIPEDKSGEDDE